MQQKRRPALQKTHEELMCREGQRGKTVRVEGLSNRFKLRDLPLLLSKWFGGVVYLLIAVILIAFGTIHIVAGFMPDLVDKNFMLPDIIRRALSEAEGANVGERGDYLNFLIGVPLAAAGSAVAAVVAASARSVANRQRIVQEMDLVDRKIAGCAETFLRLVNAFDDIHDEGGRLREDFRTFLAECNEKSVHVLSVLEGYNIPHDTYQVEGEEVDAMRERWLQPMIARIEKLRERVNDIFDGFQVLTFDPFWAKAMEMQAAKVEDEWYVLEQLMRKQFDRADPRSGVSPRYLARELRQWVRSSTVTFALLSYLYTPEESCPVEFVGGMIQLVDSKYRFPSVAVNEAWDKQSKEPVRIYNVGAAKLYTLYRALPSQEALETTVYSLFPVLDSFDSRAYFQTLPDKRRIMNDLFLEALDRVFDTPERLIYEQGVTRQELNYRPKRIASGGSQRNRRLRKSRERVAPGITPSTNADAMFGDPETIAVLNARIAAGSSALAL